MFSIHFLFKVWRFTSQRTAGSTFEETECILKDTSSRKRNKHSKHVFLLTYKTIFFENKLNLKFFVTYPYSGCAGQLTYC